MGLCECPTELDRHIQEPEYGEMLSVGGSFSARVPRSSAEVRRVFIHHIVEVEVVRTRENRLIREMMRKEKK